jgi:hypothetical protein
MRAGVGPLQLHQLMLRSPPLKCLLPQLFLQSWTHPRLHHLHGAACTALAHAECARAVHHQTTWCTTKAVQLLLDLLDDDALPKFLGPECSHVFFAAPHDH